MNSSVFSAFIRHYVIPQLVSFSQTKPFTGTGKHIVINWNDQQLAEEVIKIENPDITIAPSGETGANTFRIFFIEGTDQFISDNMAHLTFSLTHDGAFQISSIRIRNRPAQVQLLTHHPLEELKSSTLHSFFENQFRYQKTWV